jgi:hypothetical protein
MCTAETVIMGKRSRSTRAGLSSWASRWVSQAYGVAETTFNLSRALPRAVRPRWGGFHGGGDRFGKNSKFADLSEWSRLIWGGWLAYCPTELVAHAIYRCIEGRWWIRPRGAGGRRGEASSVRGKKVAFTVTVTPVIAGHATSESPRGSPALRHMVHNGGSLSATRSSNRRWAGGWSTAALAVAQSGTGFFYQVKLICCTWCTNRNKRSTTGDSSPATSGG